MGESQLCGGYVDLAFGRVTESAPVLPATAAPASLEAYLRAFDLDTGELVGEIELPGNAYGSPMTYMVDGRQYIAVPMGNSNSAPVLVGLALALPIR